MQFCSQTLLELQDENGIVYSNIVYYSFVKTSFSAIWSQMKICFFLSIQVAKGDYHSDLYSAWNIWPIGTAASLLAVKLRLTNLQKMPFHILLRETLPFKLCNVIQSSWNQEEGSSPDLAKLEVARLVPQQQIFWKLLCTAVP